MGYRMRDVEEEAKVIPLLGYNHDLTKGLAVRPDAHELFRLWVYTVDSDVEDGLSLASDLQVKLTPRGTIVVEVCCHGRQVCVEFLDGSNVEVRRHIYANADPMTIEQTVRPKSEPDTIGSAFRWLTTRHRHASHRDRRGPRR